MLPTARASDVSLTSSFLSSNTSTSTSRLSIDSTNTDYSRWSVSQAAASLRPTAASRSHGNRTEPGELLFSRPMRSANSRATKLKGKGKAKANVRYDEELVRPCSHCGKKAKKTSDLKDQLLEVCPPLGRGTAAFPCYLCGEELDRQCIYCSKTARKNSDLKDHLLDICPSLGRGTQALQCNLCGHLGRVYTQMKAHCHEYHPDHLVETRDLPTSMEHLPAKYGYSSIALPGKKKFACLCKDGIYTDVDKLFKHFNKSPCIRVGRNEADHCNRFLALVLEGRDEHGSHTGLFAEALKYSANEEHLLDMFHLVKTIPIHTVKATVDRLEWGIINLGALNGRGYSDIPRMAKVIVALLVDIDVDLLEPLATRHLPLGFWSPDGPLLEQPFPEYGKSVVQSNLDLGQAGDLDLRPYANQGAADDWYELRNSGLDQFNDLNTQLYTGPGEPSRSFEQLRFESGEVDHPTEQPDIDMGEVSELAGYCHRNPSEPSKTNGIDLDEDRDFLENFDFNLSDQLLQSISDIKFEAWLDPDYYTDSTRASDHETDIDQRQDTGPRHPEAASGIALPTRCLSSRASISATHSAPPHPPPSAPLPEIPPQASWKKGKPLSYGSQVYPEPSRGMAGPAKAWSVGTTTPLRVDGMSEHVARESRVRKRSPESHTMPSKTPRSEE